MSQMNPVRILIYYRVCLRPVLLLSSHTSLGVFSPWFLPTKTFCCFYLRVPAAFRAHLILCFIILVTLDAVTDTSSFHRTSYCCIFGEFPLSDVGPETDHLGRFFVVFAQHIQAVVECTVPYNRLYACTVQFV